MVGALPLVDVRGADVVEPRDRRTSCRRGSLARRGEDRGQPFGHTFAQRIVVQARPALELPAGEVDRRAPELKQSAAEGAALAFFHQQSGAPRGIPMGDDRRQAIKVAWLLVFAEDRHRIDSACSQRRAERSQRSADHNHPAAAPSVVGSSGSTPKSCARRSREEAIAPPTPISVPSGNRRAGLPQQSARQRRGGSPRGATRTAIPRRLARSHEREHTPDSCCRQQQPEQSR